MLWSILTPCRLPLSFFLFLFDWENVKYNERRMCKYFFISSVLDGDRQTTALSGYSLLSDRWTVDAENLCGLSVSASVCYFSTQEIHQELLRESIKNLIMPSSVSAQCYQSPSLFLRRMSLLHKAHSRRVQPLTLTALFFLLLNRHISDEISWLGIQENCYLIGSLAVNVCPLPSYRTKQTEKEKEKKPDGRLTEKQCSAVMSPWQRREEGGPKAYGRRWIPWVKLEQQRKAQNLLSLYKKNSKTTRRYWAARCIS